MKFLSLFINDKVKCATENLKYDKEMNVFWMPKIYFPDYVFIKTMLGFFLFMENEFNTECIETMCSLAF